ncbi:MAG: discoidin domain-containing protein, partial [Nitrospirae bacterium]|nr:discoidin domain-containing protein [Nitrospirota bacterium]
PGGWLGANLTSEPPIGPYNAKYHRHILSFVPSPDAQKIAIITLKEWTTISSKSISELWVIDIDGRNLKLLDSIDSSPECTDPGALLQCQNSVAESASIADGVRHLKENTVLEWAPDSETITYPVIRWHGPLYQTQKHGFDVMTINIRTREKLKMFTREVSDQYWTACISSVGSSRADLVKYTWSPDGRYLAVAPRAYDLHGYSMCVNDVIHDGLRIISKDGNSNTPMFNYNPYVNSKPVWIDDTTLFATSDNYVLQYDGAGGGWGHFYYAFSSADIYIGKINDVQNYYTIPLVINYNLFSDKTKILYSTNTGAYYYPPLNSANDLKFFDMNTKSVSLIKDPDNININRVNNDNSSATALPGFSPDGKKIAFDMLSPNGYRLDVADVSTRSVKTFDSDITSEYFSFLWSFDPGYLLTSVSSYLGSELSVVNVNSGEKTFLTKGYLSPIERKLMEASRTLPLVGKTIYYRDPYLSAMKFVADLTAELLLAGKSSHIDLTGTVTDLHLEGWKIEFATSGDSDNWQQIIAFSDVAVINGTLTPWVPPGDGIYYLRLTAWDKAGNVAESRKKVSWHTSIPSKISDITVSDSVFSPNGDGKKDIVDITYRVIEPVNFELSVYDHAGSLIRSFTQTHSEPGAYSITWDGRGASGTVVSDGIYAIKVLDLEKYVEVDNTLPKVYLSVVDNSDTFFISPGSVSFDLKALAMDNNFKEWKIYVSDILSGEKIWRLTDSGTSELFVSVPYAGIRPVPMNKHFRAKDVTGKEFKIEAEDDAGNKSFATVSPGENIWISAELVTGGPAKLYVTETITQPIDFIILEREFSATFWGTREWTSELILSGRDSDLSEYFTVLWDYAKLRLVPLSFNLKAIDRSGREFNSNRLWIGGGGGSQSISPPVKDYLIVTKILPPSFEDPDHFSVGGFHNIEGGPWSLGLEKSIVTAQQLDWQPTVSLTLPPPGEFEVKVEKDYFDLCKEYIIKFVASGPGSATIESFTFTYPSPYPELKTPCVNLEYSYLEAATCNSLSLQTEVATSLDSSQSLFYELLELSVGISDSTPPAKDASLNRFSVASPTYGKVYSTIFDVSSFAEGEHSLVESLKYRMHDPITNAPVERELVIYKPLQVDKTLPVSTISYPGRSAAVCLVSKSNGNTQMAVPIQGEASDDWFVKKYEFYYENGTTTDNSTPTLSSLKGVGPMRGEFGLLALPDSAEENYFITMKVVDNSGNVRCTSTAFSVDKSIQVGPLTLDKRLFSPNGDGIMDGVVLTYSLFEKSDIEINIYGLAGGSPVRSVKLNGLSAGQQSFLWDGKNNSGVAAPDGQYSFVLSARDTCGNLAQNSLTVELDSTRPEAVITSPVQGQVTGVIVDVRGTAYDPRFKSFALEVGQGDVPTDWIMLAEGTASLRDGRLGTWNTYGLEGKWTLRLTVTDAAGNVSSGKTSVDFLVRKSLIKDYYATSGVISPNGDGKKDAAAISFTVVESCTARIDIADSNGSVIRTYIDTITSAGSRTFIWDGRDNSGTVLTDGVYTVTLSASPLSDPSAVQLETLTVIVDAIPPTIDIKLPADKSYVNGDILISGTISDKNISEYAITYTGDTGSATINSGAQNRENYSFGALRALPEGEYAIIIQAKDVGDNVAERHIAVSVDNTPPKASLSSPRDGELYGQTRDIIMIAGSITEKNPDSYILRYGAGENPSQWTEFANGTNLSGVLSLPELKVGKTSMVTDGIYSISLLTRDKAGLTSEAKTKIIVDNTPPEVLMSQPWNGQYVRSAIDIKGTVYDANLERFNLDVSAGRCDVASRWVEMVKGISSIKDSAFTAWKILPADGSYCLRLKAIDKLGQTSQAQVDVTIDTHPPAAPSVTGGNFERTSVSLAWVGNGEEDLFGFNLYRNGQKVNAAIIKETLFVDRDLKDGMYSYTVTALDIAGNESSPSRELKVWVDITAPASNILSPTNGSHVSGLLEIKGVAFSRDDFKQYRVSIGTGSNPTSWNSVRISPVSVSGGILASLDTLVMVDGVYSAKLESEDNFGNITVSIVSFIVDNTCPAPPVLISATACSEIVPPPPPPFPDPLPLPVPTPETVCGADVTISWTAISEPDLSGYLVYRSGQLVNSGGLLIRDLRPYIIGETTYIDKAVPDGRYIYYVVAIDKAGNLSGPSNAIEVEIDVRVPRATIVEPLNGTKFESKLRLKADSQDNDIAAIQFQYKKADGWLWTNLGNAIGQRPFEMELNPVASGLSFGDYNLRAVATDHGGQFDWSPQSITVQYKDLTPPSAPKELSAKVSGNSATLSWQANNEPDLKFYYIYRKRIGVESSFVLMVVSYGQSFTDQWLADGQYDYFIKAVDINNNQSSASNYVSAKIYAPTLMQPYTPLERNIVHIEGNGVPSSASVVIYNETSAGKAVAGNAGASSLGAFSFDVTLAKGENRIAAIATDTAGNVSRESEAVFVVFNEPPSVPSGLSASADGYNVSLAWNPNPEADVIGYNLYRDGVKINKPEPLRSGNVTASSASDYYTYNPSNAFDSNLATSWRSSESYVIFEPVWWKIDLPTPQLISELNIHWESGLHSGKDFEIQVWSGYAWITQSIVSGNTGAVSSIEFKPSYRTDKVRINITDTNDAMNSLRMAGIAEVEILKDALIGGKDQTPPIINIMSPLMWGYFDTVVPISVIAADDNPGMDYVLYSIDGGELA